MSSPSSSPGLLMAMASPAPKTPHANANRRPPPRKRQRTDANLDSEDQTEDVPSIDFTANANDIDAAKAFASRKRLKPEQITELEQLMNVRSPLSLEFFVTFDTSCHCSRHCRFRLPDSLWRIKPPTILFLKL
jgi:hypothetical protein